MAYWRVHFTAQILVHGGMTIESEFSPGESVISDELRSILGEYPEQLSGDHIFDWDNIGIALDYEAEKDE